jgi:hypothetical protein
MRFSRGWLWRMPFSGMWRHVDLVWTDVSEERIASIFRVEKSARDEPAWAGGCPEDGGNTFLQNVGSQKNYKAPHPRKRHSSRIWNPHTSIILDLAGWYTCVALRYNRKKFGSNSRISSASLQKRRDRTFNCAMISLLQSPTHHS